jgi:hypothetical protein
VHIRNRTLLDWTQALDLNAFADLAIWSKAEDFLLPPVRALGVRAIPKNRRSGVLGAVRNWYGSC